MRVDHQSPDDVPQNPSHAAIGLGISYGDGEAETSGKKKISSEPTDSAACNASRRWEAAALGRNDAPCGVKMGNLSRVPRGVAMPRRRRSSMSRRDVRWRDGGREGGADFSECEDDVVSYELVTLQHIWST